MNDLIGILLLLIGICLLPFDALYISKAIKAYRLREWDKISSIYKKLLILTVIVFVVFLSSFFNSEMSKSNVSPAFALTKAISDIWIFAFASATLLYVLWRKIKKGKTQGNKAQGVHESNMDGKEPDLSPGPSECKKPGDAHKEDRKI